jgi:hypothetical protein
MVMSCRKDLLDNIKVVDNVMVVGREPNGKRFLLGFNM